MGQMIDGTWHPGDHVVEGGRFKRIESVFRHWVTADGSAGPSGEGGFRAEPGRYHLYVSVACPWAHRTLIFRKLKGLEGMIGLSAVNSFKGDDGWTFEKGADVIADSVNHASKLHEVYAKADARYTGRVTVPVLWDKQRSTVVNNESSEIIRMFNSAFDQVGAAPGDYYPNALRAEIEAVNARVYDTVNNGVYKSGFATTQDAYEEGVVPLFETLDWLDERLATRRYLMGDRITEADWRLFTTLIRFDSVYVAHFKCNIRRLIDYDHLWPYTRDLYQVPGVAETVNLPHTKRHYFRSHESINPRRIVPMGPALDLDEPHRRDNVTKAA